MATAVPSSASQYALEHRITRSRKETQKARWPNGGMLSAADRESILLPELPPYSPQIPKSRIVNSAASISREEGIRALWKGLTPFATHLYLKYALRFGTNASFQSMLVDNQGKLSNARRILAGLGAGITEALVIVTPFEVVKIRLQSQKGLNQAELKYKGPVDAALKTMRHEGITAMWTGGAPTVFRNGLNQASMFYSKNVIDQLLWKKQDGDKYHLALWQSMFSGFLATLPGMFLTNPFDIVKTRLMAQEKVAGILKYRGIMGTAMTIAKEEGVLRLYQGLLPRILRVPPGMAITWGVTDQIVQMYERGEIASLLEDEDET